MQSVLVGSTGFVGGNLAASYAFSACYHAADITESYGTRPDLVVYAGVKAEKFLANAAPEKDREAVLQAYENLTRMEPKRVVLISTADVYKTPLNVNECTSVVTQGLHPYGLNRFELEQKVRGAWPDALIVRLPALYGKGLKKNFLYDLMTVTPAMLKEEAYASLCQKNPCAAGCYALADNGFYKLKALSVPDAAALRAWFSQNDFNALSFTDSRAVYQFYGLSRLWQDIETALREDLRLLNITAAPLSAADIHMAVTGRSFCNEITSQPVCYHVKSVYAGLFGGENGYFTGAESTLEGIRDFCKKGGYGI